MSPRLLCLAAILLSSGCATARYYDEDGKELPGLPFVWKDAQGKPHLAYVVSSSGIGEATFTVERTESGGYTRFTNNLDSTAAATLTGDVLDEVFKAGRAAARAEMREKILQIDDPNERGALLRRLDGTAP